MTNKRQKICSRLWNGLVVRHDGNVFPCCDIGVDPKHSIGNINNSHMDEIINSPKLIEMRRNSINSELECYEGCDQVKYFEEFKHSNPTNLKASIDDYKDLQIEYGEKCNVNCVMCWQDHDNSTYLSFDTLIKNLPRQNWDRITLYGGEVFSLKDSVKHMRLLLNEGKKNVIIITNGKALSSERLAREIVEKGFELSISINACTEEMHTYIMRPEKPFFYQLLESVGKLQQYKKELNRGDFSVSAHFTVIPETLEEMPNFIKNFKAMGFDRASITFDHRYFPNAFRDYAILPRILRWSESKMFKLMTKVTKEIAQLNNQEDLILTCREYLVDEKLLEKLTKEKSWS